MIERDGDDLNYKALYTNIIKEKRELEKKVEEYQDYIFFLLKIFKNLTK